MNKLMSMAMSANDLKVAAEQVATHGVVNSDRIISVL